MGQTNSEIQRRLKVRRERRNFKMVVVIANISSWLFSTPKKHAGHV